MAEGEKLGFLHKRIANVPVVYFALVFVVILAYLAWRMKAKNADTSTTGSGDPGAGDVGPAATDPGSSGFVANPPPVYETPAPGDTTSTVDTNEAWIKRGVDWSVSSGLAGGGAALVALNKFVAGEQLSYDEGRIRDAVIQHFGAPPEHVDAGGTGTKQDPPATRQFTHFPGRHTVKGSNDNTYAKLATLYYGSAVANNVGLIRAANVKLGDVATIPVGSVVEIPAYREAVYYVTPKGVDTAQEIAARNGTTGGAIVHLNPDLTFPVHTGTRVRVR